MIIITKGIEIVATGRSLPKKVYLNDDMKRFVETDDAWISERTGIKQRYFCDLPTESCSSLAIESAKIALERAKISPQDIAVCIVATFTPDYSTPSTACLVQRELNLSENTLCFDLNAACTGFVYAVDTARALLTTQQKPYALVIGAERISGVLDFTDRGSCVLFGDGAGAAILKLSDNHRYFSMFGTRGDNEILYASNIADDTKLRMNGKEVFRFASEAVVKTLNTLLSAAQKNAEDVNHIICHQANARIIDFAAKRAGLSPDSFYKNIDRYGNTSAASIPIVLDEMYEKNLLKAEDSLLLIGFGAGLTYGGIYMDRKD